MSRYQVLNALRTAYGLIGLGEAAPRPVAVVHRVAQGLSLKLPNTEAANAQGPQLTHAHATPMPVQVS